MDLLEACCNSRELWDETLRSIQHPLLVTSHRGDILFVGPGVEKVLGYSADDLVGKSFSLLFTPEDLSCLYHNLLYLARNHRSFEGEIMLMGKDKARFIAYIILRPYFEPQYEDGLAIVSIQNIDKKKLLEKAIKEIYYDDMVKIADGIAHEIRNPLMGIGGFLNRIFKPEAGQQANHAYYEHIMGNLQKIENLVKKVEYFVRLPEPHFRRQSIKDLIEEAAAPYGGALQERGVALTIDVEAPPLLMDQVLMVRAFSSLIENALDACSSGASLHFSSETEANRCSIYVTDTGSGVSPVDISSIFNPFFSTKPDGAGIDLAIVKRIMKIHGGDISVRSEPGEATTFTLSFPCERRRAIRVKRLGE